MGKTIDRKHLRNAPLLPFCGKAHTTRHEYGPDDNRVFCYGVIDKMTDEYLVACKKCKAFVSNSTPQKEEIFHEVERFDNLMYDGCEPHWHCIHCDNYWPFHCYKKKDLEHMPCPSRQEVQNE